MAQPKVTVNITNGALGGVPVNEDGLAEMVVTATAVAGLPLATPTLIYSLAEAVAKGITATATPFAYRQIKGFYDGYNFITGSERAPLYLMTVADTVTLANMTDQAYATGLKKLHDFALGKPRLAGVARKPDVGYSPVVTGGVEADSLTALDNAQTLAATYSTANNPLMVLVEQRGLLYANIATLTDARTKTDMYAMPIIGSQLSDGSADVGIMLGMEAGAKVNQSIGRVRFGAITLFSQAYIGDKKVEEFTAIDTLYDKGYNYFRTLPNRSGYFVSGDATAVPLTNDFCWGHRVRTINKAQRIAARVYTDWINEDVETIEGGKLAPAVIATLESEIKQAIDTEMAGEISEFIPFIDPDQNVVSTNKVKITGKIRGRNVLMNLDMDMGFTL